MIKKGIFLLFASIVFLNLIAIGQNILGQQQAEYSSKLPEVQSMQKAIDFPASYFTGQANVSIPLYVASSKNISVPITFKYNSGGIKADEIRGWYGIGWNLEAGGMITRTVKGNEDEGLRFEMLRHKKINRTLLPGDPGYYFYKWNLSRDSIINMYQKFGGYFVDGGNIGHSSSDLNTVFNTHNQALSIGSNPAPLSLLYFNEGISDGEPDVFYYNFGEHSGKFIFGADNKPILIPYNEDIKIIPELKSRFDTEYHETWDDPNDSTVYKMYYFNSFKISIPDGKDYYFGESDSAKILTPVLGKPSRVNGWYLTRIVDRINADTVYFEYTKPLITNITDLENKQQFIKNDNFGCQGGLTFNFSLQPNQTGILSKIITGKEVVTFGRGAFNVADRISGKIYRQIQFGLTSLLSHRFALSTISDWDVIKNKVSMYSFEYYDLGNYGGPAAQDFWGYHNGADNGRKLMITSDTCTTDGANRFSQWPAMELDALKSVIYPTGGKTIFEYEPHDAFAGRNLSNQIVESDAFYVGQGLNYVLTAPNSIGGLRIKKLIQYDPISKDTLTKRFIYKRFGNNMSSGLLHIPPSLNIDYSSLSCGTSASPFYLRSGKNLYIGSGTGQHVTYNNVTVQEEKNGISNGYTEYEFYNEMNSDSCFYSNASSDSTNFSLNNQYNVFPGTQFKLLPENFLNGKQKEKRIFTRSGTLLEQETTTYKSTIYPEFATPVLFNSVYKKDACSVTFIASAGSYAQSSWVPMDETLEVYPDWFNANLEDQAEYASISPIQPNKGIRPILPPPYTYYYMYRYRISKMSVRPVQTIKKTFESPSSYVIDTTTFLYDNTAHINPTSVSSRNSKGETTTQQTLYSFDFNDVNNGDSTIYFMKNAFVNVPVASFNYLNSNVISGGYRTYKYKPGTSRDVFFISEESRLLSGSTGIPPASLNINSGFPKNLNFPNNYFRKEMLFKYNPDNSIAYINKRGNDKIVFLWDYNKNYVVTQAIGSDSADIAFTSFETSYNGNWIVGSASRDTLNSITGKKSYNLSGGNITKAGLNVAKLYTVSYWSFSGAATVNSTTASTGSTKNGWTYYEHKLPLATSSVSISGNVKMDELRLFPSDAQVTTYTFDPVMGVTNVDLPDNTITYYEYDGLGRLIFVRDADKKILKAADYFHSQFSSDTAVWKFTYKVTIIKCTGDTNYNSNMASFEQIDINSNSATYNTYRSIDQIYLTNPTGWTYTTAFRCLKDTGNNNTGIIEKEQKDMNPCSNTYNQTRWVTLGSSKTYCPLPCIGEDKRIINGVCVTGIKIITMSGYNNVLKKWACQYHYEWFPDCIKSQDYTEYKSFPCMPGGSCSPL